jgi:hypothetical protein
MFLGSTLYPSSPGLDTRFHVFGGLAFAAFCYAIVVISVEVLPLGTPGPFAIATAVGLVLALGFAHRLRDDIGRWDSGARAQRQFLSALKRTAPAPPSGSTIFSFGYPGEAAPGLPIFTHFWVLNGAVRLTFDDPRSLVYRFTGETELCARRRSYTSHRRASSIRRAMAERSSPT